VLAHRAEGAADVLPEAGKPVERTHLTALLFHLGHALQFQ
jgi:hypothetical protein